MKEKKKEKNRKKETYNTYYEPLTEEWIGKRS